MDKTQKFWKNLYINYKIKKLQTLYINIEQLDSKIKTFNFLIKQ